MPYIPQSRRANLPAPMNSSDLSFLFTDIINKYLKSRKVNCQTLNEVLGALETTKIELQSRVINPLKQEKRLKNGDVYEL